MRLIFMSKNKASACKALARAIEKGIEIVAVVLSNSDRNSEIEDLAESFDIPVCADADIYGHLAGTEKLNFDIDNIDVVVSFLFPRKILKPIINLARLGCINFHSAPLPKYRGWGVYNAAILTDECDWGVSAHFVDEDFDTGDLIKVNRFQINPKKETAISLDQRSQGYLVELFKEVVDMIIRGEPLPRQHQDQSEAATYSKKDTLRHEIVNFYDPAELIDKKIRAFWHPPFGAQIVLDGKKYFLVDEDIMRDIADKYKV